MQHRGGSRWNKLKNTMENNRCLLCKYREADKTGSHIIPSFLMKRINGDGQRDHEVGFEIKNGVVDTYFGRDIYEDKRKEITDEDEKLESRTNYDVRDYIFCSECEKYFGKLESAYATSLSLNCIEGKITVNNKVAPGEAILFWCSILWRVSVTEHFGQRLDLELEERLRNALISQNVGNLKMKYALFRCKNYGKQTGRGTFVCADVKGNSALLVIDDFMAVLIFDIGEEKHEVELLDMGFSLIPDSLNDGLKREEISAIPVEIFNGVTASVIRSSVKSMKLPEKFLELHKIFFDNVLPEEMMKEVLNLIQANPCKIGDRYTAKHYALCYKEVLKKHGYIRENEDNTFTVIRNNRRIT